MHASEVRPGCPAILVDRASQPLCSVATCSVLADGDLGLRDPFDPKENIEAGAKYLKQLIDKYKGNLGLALGAYNAGASVVDQAGGIPDIPETRAYVQAILDKIEPTRTDPPSIRKPKPIEN